jgi:uncharacterized membrane protein YgcG
MLVQDVADLCVAALSHPGARNTTLGCTTLDPLSDALYWTGSTWAPIYPRDISPLVVSGPKCSPLLDRIGQPDTTPLEEKPHVLAVRVAVVVALVAVSVFIAAVALGLLSVWPRLGATLQRGSLLGFVAWLFASLLGFATAMAEYGLILVFVAWLFASLFAERDDRFDGVRFDGPQDNWSSIMLDNWIVHPDGYGDGGADGGGDGDGGGSDGGGDGDGGGD